MTDDLIKPPGSLPSIRQPGEFGAGDFPRSAVYTATPQPVATTGSPGRGPGYALSDHVHQASVDTDIVGVATVFRYVAQGGGSPPVTGNSIIWTAIEDPSSGISGAVYTFGAKGIYTMGFTVRANQPDVAQNVCSSFTINAWKNGVGVGTNVESWEFDMNSWRSPGGHAGVYEATHIQWQTTGSGSGLFSSGDTLTYNIYFAETDPNFTCHFLSSGYMLGTL